ncbi:MAG: hypothetical protein HUK22_01905, partial [Thermoguttaceae bacterium]|nr:hypothetical protein [Thermoguttaceae bacterium]
LFESRRDLGWRLRRNGERANDERRRRTVYVALSTTSPEYCDTVYVSTTPAAAQTGASFQWYNVNADGSETEIPGATDSFFKVKDDAVGKALKVVVAGSGIYVRSASVTTEVVPNPKISGVYLSMTTPTYNKTISASIVPSLARATAAFQWYRVAEDGTETAIEGATNSYYKVANSADLNCQLKVVATGDGIYAGSAEATTPYVAMAAPLVAITFSSNAPTVGELVKFTKNPGAATCTYQWYRVDPTTQKMTRIEGATYSSYRATKADVGYQLKAYAYGYDNYRGSKAAQTSSVVVAANTVDTALTEIFAEEGDELFFEF